MDRSSLLILAFCPVVPAADSPHIVPVRGDHHVHLTSPAIQAFLPEFCANMRRFGNCDPALTTPHSVEDLLAAMNRAGIQRALVLSNGYLAESPMMEPQRPDAAGLMLPKGTDILTAAYAGDPNFMAASSSPLAEGVGTPAAQPKISPSSGTYTSSQTVTITDATPGAIIYYTTDGTVPSRSSPVFNPMSPIVAVSASKTLKAIAVAHGYTPSSQAIAAYTIAP